MEGKSKQIKLLTDYLLEKYGLSNIIVTDYWDADNSAIGLADKTTKYTVYISDYNRTDNKFFVSLENPPTKEDFPYTAGEDFDNLSAGEVEEILIKHLRISDFGQKLGNAP